jgi:MFS family permease
MERGVAERERAAEANRKPLDWLNFLLADVRGGVSPFLAIYLMSSQHWDAGSIGIVLSIAGIATVTAQSPAGAIVDSVTWKRALVMGAAIMVALSVVFMVLVPTFWPVAIAQGALGVAEAVFPVAISAISLGIVGRKAFPRRIGRNEAWNHAGNVVAATAAGLAGWLIAPSATLWIAATLALSSAFAARFIDPSAIDHDVARGEEEGQDGEPGSLRLIWENKPLMWFTAAITLFHFANAAMLPLAGEKLSMGHPEESPLFMSSCIIVAQLVMVPMAILAGHRADVWGRKPLFLAGFAVLPIRGLLFSIAGDPYSIIAIQILDGIGAGIFGTLFFIVVSDFTRGTGRYNLAQGVSAASWGLGAALSNGVAGMIVASSGFTAAFSFLAACAALAFAIFLFAVPESRDFRREPGDRRAPEMAAEKAKA